MPIEYKIINGRLRPNLDLHESDREPSTGQAKNPNKGLKHQHRV